MSELTHVYTYGGATCEDLYEVEDQGQLLSLDTLSTPQFAFVSSKYSLDLVMDLARDMWEEIAEFYAGDLDRPFATRAPLEALRMVASSKVCERPPNFDGELPVKEVTVIQFFGEADFDNREALMQIVVQKRPVRLPKRRARTLAEILPDFGARPGDNGSSEA